MCIEKEKFESLAYEQYKLAIDARDKLNDNYHKWMTFYYVAIGAILVALVTLMTTDNKADFSELKFFLSCMAIFISMIWNLSCKGYNYWSNNWIYIIKNLETKVIGGHEELGIYSMFSETVIENESKSGYLNKPANISTPKLTLVASFFSMLIWAIFASIEFFKMYHITICMKVACISIGVFVLFILYVLLLNSSFLESRPTSFSSDRIERFRRN